MLLLLDVIFILAISYFYWSPELGIKLPEFKSLTHLDAVIVGKFPSNSILFSFGFFCYYPCTPIKIFWLDVWDSFTLVSRFLGSLIYIKFLYFLPNKKCYKSRGWHTPITLRMRCMCLLASTTLTALIRTQNLACAR